MLIFECMKCSRIFRFSSMLGPSESRCTACRGQIVCIGRDETLPKMKRPDQEQWKDKRPNWPTLLGIFKGFGIAWGVGGAVNLARKEEKDIRKRDLLHVAIPYGTVRLIQRLEHRLRLRELPLDSPTESESKLNLGPEVRRVIDYVIRREKFQECRTESSTSEGRKLDARPEPPKDVLTQRKVRSYKKGWDIVDSRISLWLEILSRYPVILILGAKGIGKSCLAFYLLEIMRYRGPCYLYRFPEEGKDLLPPWLGILQELADAPAGSTILIDEAYLSFFSRDSQSGANKEITRIVNLTRQKNICLIFVAHESRHLEKNILSGIDTLIFKKPAPLQIALDRSFLKPYLLKAQKAFEGKNEAACKSLSYVCFSPSGFEGTLENGKASFWSEELSHIFASGHQGRIEVPAKELSREEKKKRAQKLHDFYHHSYGEISKELGAAKTTVYRWVNENNEGGTEE